MIEKRKLFKPAVGLAVALALVVSCDGDGGNGTGPGVDTGLFGESASAVESLVDKFIAPNEPAFRSLDFFVNLIALALNVAPPAAPVGAPSAALLQSCVPNAEGETLEYDEGSGLYVAGNLQGAPANGVRFLIYEVNASGSVVTPLNQIGYVDVSCTPPPSLVMNVALVVNDVTVVNMDASGSLNVSTLFYSLTITGSISTPDGSEQLVFGELGSGTTGTLGFSENTGFDYSALPAQDIYAVFSLFDDLTTGNFSVIASVERLTGDLGDWKLQIDLAGDANGNVAGPAIFRFPVVGGTGGEVEVVACLSGSYDAPVVQVASVQCAGEVQDLNDLEPNGQAKRDAIRRAYIGLTQLFEPLQLIVNTGLTVATRAVG